MENDDELNKNTLSIKFCQHSSDDSIDGSANVDAGVVWERLMIGYRIMDLRSDRFNEALELVKEYFFTSEPMCRATLLAKDKTSVRTYLDLITHWMKEMRSMCAIDEGTGKVVGIAVASLNRKADQPKECSRIRMNQGEAIFNILTLKSSVFGCSHLYEKYEISEYFRVHVLCVNSNFRNKGIGTALVRSCVDCCRRLQLPTCIGAFSSGAAQTIAEHLGFETLAEIPYREYVIPGRIENPFVDTGSGNYSIACMGLPTLVPANLARSTSMTTSMTSSSKKKKKTTTTTTKKAKET